MLLLTHCSNTTSTTTIPQPVGPSTCPLHPQAPGLQVRWSRAQWLCGDHVTVCADPVWHSSMLRFSPANICDCHLNNDVQAPAILIKKYLHSRPPHVLTADTACERSPPHERHLEVDDNIQVSNSCRQVVNMIIGHPRAVTTRETSLWTLTYSGCAESHWTAA